MARLIDTHGDLLISLEHGGIKLIKPNNKHTNLVRSLPNINAILNLPINVYFLNCDNMIQSINTSTMITGCFSSINKAIGKNIMAAATKEAASRAIGDNSEVINNKQMKIFNENFTRQIDGVSFSALSFKFPWYNENNDIIGLFGFSIVVENNNILELANQLQSVVKIGLLNTHQNNLLCQNIFPSKEIANVRLTHQEIKCLHLLKQGMTMKMIARSLELSPRTIEHYLENIKSKFNVNTKSELIYILTRNAYDEK